MIAYDLHPEYLPTKYAEELKNERINERIITMPNWFEIKHTEYTKTNAKVTVIEKFKIPGQNYTEIKEYVYYLVNFDGIWLITNYEVTSLGNE